MSDADNDADEQISLDGDTVKLPEKCKLQQAEELRELFTTIPNESDLVLDASAVEYMGSAGVLAIASLIHTRHEGAVTTAVKAAPPAMIDGFKGLGLFQEMMKLEFRE